MSKVVSIHIYPIKSLGGISLQEAKVESAGMQYDRRWMLVDADNNFMTQRTIGKMCLFKQSIEGDNLVVSYGQKRIQVPLEESEGKLEDATIWGHQTNGYEVSPEVSAWFTEELQMPARLLRMNHANYRKSETKGDLKMSLADGYPYLFLGTASLDLLNSKLEETVPINRFRANIILDTNVAHAEDELGDFALGSARFKGSHPCGRCKVVTINQETGVAAKEPLRTMNTYRKVEDENRVNFGMNVFCTENGRVKVGDSIHAI